MTAIPFTNGFYQNPNTSLSNQRCVNLYTHVSEKATETQEQLLGFSGIEQKGDTTYGKNRGSIVFNNELYVLNAQTFAKIDSGNGVTSLGTVGGFGRVSMAENGESICIVDPNGSSYFYDDTNGLVQITDSDFASFGRARTVTYSDGFFIFNTDSILFQSSLATVNKGQDFNALEFEDAEQFTDDLVAVIASQGNFYAMGVLSYEVYRLKTSSTTGEFAFQRVTVQNNERGLRGRFNIVNTDSALYFIGGGKFEKSSVWELRGASPKKISNDAIDSLIDDETSGFAMAWAENGQFFRSFTFNTTTIVYNALTSRWCELQDSNLSKGWRIQSLIYVYNKIYVNDDTGLFGVLDKDVYTWFGDTILDYCTTQPFYNGQRAFAIQTLEAICQAGVGNSDETNPTITMSFSKDGVLFAYERSRELGNAGERSKRQVWRNLGRFDDTVVLKFQFGNPCRKALIGLQADFI